MHVHTCKCTRVPTYTYTHAYTHTNTCTHMHKHQVSLNITTPLLSPICSFLRLRVDEVNFTQAAQIPVYGPGSFDHVYTCGTILPSRDLEHFHLPRKFPQAPFQPIPILHRAHFLSEDYHHRLVLPILEICLKIRVCTLCAHFLPLSKIFHFFLLCYVSHRTAHHWFLM